jgi:tetratricopeptide (TPR) repeat protein
LPLSAPQTPVWWQWIPFLLALAAYINTLDFGFVLDDFAAIVENNSTRKGMAALGEIFRTSYRYGYLLISDELYRPLPKAIYAVLWDWSPNNPAPGHFFNIVVFALTCLMIYRSVAAWWPSYTLLPLVTSSLFAVHPIHTEVVANIKSSDEVLAFFFGLLSLHFFIQYHRSSSSFKLTMSLVFFFFGFLCKESTITFLPVFHLLAYCCGEGNWKQSLRGVAWLLIPTLLFFAIRSHVLSNSGMMESALPSVADNALVSAADPIDRLAGAVRMLGLYAGKLLLPLSLSFDLSYPQVGNFSKADPLSWLSALAFTVALLLAIWGIRQRQLFSFALFWFFITVSVSSNIFLIIGTHYGERLMYTPSFAVALLAGVGVEQMRKKLPLSGIFMATSALTVFFLYLTIDRNPVWESNETLYHSGLSSAPGSARVQYYNGLYLLKPEYLDAKAPAQRDSAFKAGIGHLQKAVELYPAFTDAWTQLGVAAFRKKDYKAALEYYGQSVRYNPYDPVTRNNMGSVYFEMQNYNEALRLYQEAIRVKADYADAYMNIGSCYGVAGQYDLALQNLEKSIAINPDLAQAYYMISITWQNKGNPQMANRYMEMYNQRKGVR